MKQIYKEKYLVHLQKRVDIKQRLARKQEKSYFIVARVTFVQVERAVKKKSWSTGGDDTKD